MDVYVATDGNDQNTGHLKDPVNTFAKALEILRNSQDSLKQLIIRGGLYLNANIELNAQDSGLTIAAYPGEIPVLYGGYQETQWAEAGNLLYAEVDPALVPADGIRHLVVNGQPAARARYPETGALNYSDLFDVPWMSTTGGGWKRKPTEDELITMHFSPEQLGDWLDTENAEIRVYHQWDESVVGIKHVDWERSVMTFSTPLGHPPGAFGGHHNDKFQTYIILNTRHGMTQPGNWYFDRQESRVYYYPTDEQRKSGISALIPTREVIISLFDTRATIKDITITELTLEGSNCPLGYMSFAASLLKGAITIHGNAENLRFSKLLLKNTGGKGISVNNRETDFRTSALVVEHSSFTNCGGTAVCLPGSNNRISRNRIKDVGCLYPSAVALTCSGTDNTIEHNTIDGCPYIAIHGGGKNCDVNANRIRNFMRELDDGAAIYFFAAKDCVYRNNVATGDGLKRCASSYYLDERSEGSIVEHNLSINTGWPSHNHMSNNCVIRNNYFIDAAESMVTFPKSKGFTFCNNLMIAEGDIVFRHWTDETVTEMNGNVIFSKRGKVLKSLAGGGGYGSQGEEAFDVPGNWLEDPQLMMEYDQIRFGADSLINQAGTTIEPADFSGAGA